MMRKQNRVKRSQMFPKYHQGEFGWVLKRSCFSSAASCLKKDENLCVWRWGWQHLPRPLAHHSPSRLTQHTPHPSPPLWGISGVSLPSRSAWLSAFPTQRLPAFYFYFFVCVAALWMLLIEARLAFLSVIAIPCVCFYCVQLHLRRYFCLFLVGLCVCV